MKKTLILAMMMLALGCANWVKADQIVLTPGGAGDDWSTGAAAGAGELCVICQADSSPRLIERTGGSSSFELTGLAADSAAGYKIPVTVGTMEPKCDPKNMPEPASMVLFGTGLVALGVRLRRRTNA